jgi:hypothetical protein
LRKYAEFKWLSMLEILRDYIIPGIPGLTDQIYIYQAQLAAIKTPATRSNHKANNLISAID